MYNGKTVTAVILAAGSSNRMGFNTNKVYMEANGKLIIEYSLDMFLNHTLVDDIIIVIRNEDADFLNDTFLKKRHFNKPVNLVYGGNLRSDSVYNALKVLKSDIVLTQDGARPLLKKQFISECIKAMDEYYGAVVAIKNNDTLCVVDENNVICKAPQSTLYKAQTPQCFHTTVLRDCYNASANRTIATDDCFFLEASGYPIKIILGDESNIKITTPVDLKRAGEYLKY